MDSLGLVCYLAALVQPTPALLELGLGIYLDLMKIVNKSAHPYVFPEDMHFWLGGLPQLIF